LRLAGFLAGNTVNNCAAGDPYLQTNADGGRIGISSTMHITGMTGSYNICSDGVLGKIAKQLDTQLDDGVSNTGSFRIIARATAPAASGAAVVPSAELPADATSYTVCLSV
jgi:hypothetical protein